MTELTDGLKCGTCRHLHKLPADPNNLGVKRYECRAAPPQLVAFLTGPGQVQMSLHYPPLPPEFPACGQHEAGPGLVVH